VSGPGYWLKESSSFRRLLRSEHVADLRLISCFTIALGFIVLCLLVTNLASAIPAFCENQTDCANFVKSFDPKLALPLLGAAGGILVWVYRTAAMRLGVVDLFASEIMTLCRVGTAMDFGVASVERWKEKRKSHHAKSQLTHSGFYHFASQEQYFSIFSQNSKDLEVLEADVINEVTAFYTYMKVVRDLLRQVDEEARAQTVLQDHDKKIEGILFNVIYMVFLGYEAARHSIQHLVEYEPAHVENTIIILLTEIVVYKTLVTDFPKKTKMTIFVMSV